MSATRLLAGGSQRFELCPCRSLLPVADARDGERSAHRPSREPFMNRRAVEKSREVASGERVARADAVHLRHCESGAGDGAIETHLVGATAPAFDDDLRRNTR